MKMRYALSSALALGALAFAALAGPAPARAGTLSYHVTVDSSGISGTSGFVELGMSAANQPASATVTATISNVVSDGTLGAVSISTGNVSGSFSSTPLAIDNGAPSDLQQEFTYGSGMSFTLVLSGSDVGDPSAQSGTTFAFYLEDSKGMALNNGPGGEAFDFYFPPLQNMQYQTYGPTATNGPIVTITSLAVPEPSGLVLLGLGAGAVGALARRRTGRRAA